MRNCRSQWVGGYTCVKPQHHQHFKRSSLRQVRYRTYNLRRSIEATFPLRRSTSSRRLRFLAYEAKHVARESKKKQKGAPRQQEKRVSRPRQDNAITRCEFYCVMYALGLFSWVVSLAWVDEAGLSAGAR